MEAIVKGLIAELQQAIQFVELRKAPETGDSLEAVLLRAHLARCYDLLAKALGPPLKEFGESVALTPEARRTADAVGGIRSNQCFFLAQQGAKHVAYAALWPWGSDPTRLTLKVGLWQVP